MKHLISRNMIDHQYALNMRGEWVNAKMTKYRKHSVFFCDCPAKHKMKLVKPSGRLGKRVFCDYFAHISKSSRRDNGQSSVSHCSSGGESLLHRMAKQRLREMVGRYYFAVFRCTECEEEECVNTKGCDVNIEVRSSDGKWRYDCLLSRGKVPIAALEVVHTHSTGHEKVSAVLSSGLEIAEFRADDIMEQLVDGSKGIVEIDNVQMRRSRCQECLMKIALRWQRDCFVDELAELIRQEEAVGFNYERISTLQRVLAVEPLLKKCKKLLRLGLKVRARISIPRIGEITCTKTEDWAYGVILSGFNMNIATQQICVFLLQNDSDVYSINWQHRSIRREFHVFIRCSTILNRLGSLAEELVCFNDCRWPILKGLERTHGLCANCGRNGHTSERCFSKFCMLCGRSGHSREECFRRHPM